MNLKHAFCGLVCSIAVVGCAGGMGDGCCGWSGLDITGTGQIKKLRHDSPIFCPDYYEVDVSLGVMRNGVGSVSKEDMKLYVPDTLIPEMEKASRVGALIEFTYDERRSCWCVPPERLKSFKVIQ